MANSLGLNQAVGVGRQSSRGTGVAAAYFMRKLSFSPNRVVEHVNDESALGVNSSFSGVDWSRRLAEPELETYLDLDGHGLLEWGASDAYTVAATADTSGDVYAHTFTAGNATSLADRLLTLGVDDPTMGDTRFIDSVVNSLSIEANMTDRVKVNASFASRYGTTGTAVTAAIADPTYFMGRQVILEIADTVSGFTGTGIAVKTASFERTSNVDSGEDSFDLGSGEIADHTALTREATITIDRNLIDATYLALMASAGYKAVRLTMTGSATIGDTSNPSFRVTFPKCSFQFSEDSGDNKARRKETLELVAHYGEDDAASASYLWRTVVTNLVTTYTP